MRECQICGLLFLGIDCPGCGSRMTNVLDAMGEGAQTLALRGGLPGIERLGDSLSEIVEESELAEVADSQDESSLPFGVGGGASKRITSLPFGIGSKASIGYDATETTLPVTESADSTPTVDTDQEERQNENSTEQVADDIQEMEDPSPVEKEPIASESEIVRIKAVPLNEPELEPTQVSTQPLRVAAVVIEEEKPQPVKVAAITVDDEQPPPLKVATVEVEDIPIAENFEAQNGQIFADDSDVIIHDYSEDSFASEVMVNLDDIAEPADNEVMFNPESETVSGEPELFPAQALEITGVEGSDEQALARNGFEALAAREWNAAASFFQQLAKRHPTDAQIMNNYGLALLQRAISMQDDDHFSLIDGADTQFEAAIMALRQAARTDPQQTTILYNLGNALAGSGRYDKALRIFEAFLERAPPTIGTLNGRAVSLIGLGRFDEAARDIKDAVTRFGDHPVLSANLGRLTPA